MNSRIPMTVRRAAFPVTVLAGVVIVAALLAFRSRAVRSEDGRLAFTPHVPKGKIATGLRPLGLGAERDGFLFVPANNAARRKQPLLILLHGATQQSRLFERITPAADSAGVVILAPDSRLVTWDAIRDDFGPDVEFLDHAIERAFDRAYVDSCRVVIGGFSDGASYALSLGIRNAKLLKGVVAFSPGFVIPAQEIGKLPVFMRHGKHDEILPIDRASRPILAALQDAQFTVDYEEFDGPHTIRALDARAALQWVTKRSCSSNPPKG